MPGAQEYRPRFVLVPYFSSPVSDFGKAAVKKKQKQNQHFINCTTWWRRAAVCVASGIMPGVRATNPGKSSALSI